MFIVKTVATLEYCCPNGHTLLPDLLPQVNHPARFCHICCASLLESRGTFDAAFCSGCNSPVNPGGNYCPYCGLGREEASQNKTERR